MLRDVLQLNMMFKMFDIDSEDLLPDFKISIVEFGKVKQRQSPHANAIVIGDAVTGADAL